VKFLTNLREHPPPFANFTKLSLWAGIQDNINEENWWARPHRIPHLETLEIAVALTYRRPAWPAMVNVRDLTLRRLDVPKLYEKLLYIRTTGIAILAEKCGNLQRSLVQVAGDKYGDCERVSYISVV
jgi:hypothetical protein